MFMKSSIVLLALLALRGGVVGESGNGAVIPLRCCYYNRLGLQCYTPCYTKDNKEVCPSESETKASCAQGQPKCSGTNPVCVNSGGEITTAQVTCSGNGQPNCEAVLVVD
ncbi:hypothetical protein CROQUDRAFT_657430 [Cronartium quercuum f. sp. fusiforme G11]|uniref:Uncharacterized protein n=1 Tax=Cronartium quercuum f. sp. fusiforme G11 TaxID=708437 RepID=A0A9P6TD90_9BASI|nr:hypothetical protein CROQUDRAFT_657430 [Cronartium quercuum f. sp. fusiforme G11]